MNTHMLKKARTLFNVDYIPRQINRANQLKWARSIKALGENWLLAKQVMRHDNPTRSS